MAEPTPEQVLEALRKVLDPELNRDLVSAGMIKNVRVENGVVRFDLELTTPACPLREHLTTAARQAVEALPGVRSVHINVTARVPHGAPKRATLPDVKNIVAVGSGKGGVGKSTVAVNIAVALGQMGAKVGLLDGDIYGPNVPRMLGVHGKPRIAGNKIQTLSAWGIRVMSIGFFVDADAPVIWRGPMLHKAMQQLLEDVNWGELDYLLVDLPPGTGDVQISLSQLVQVTGAIVITTPQDVALFDALKSVAMFEKTDVPVLGIVENMSYFICPHCGKRTEIFRRGAVERECERRKLRFLGAIPIVAEVSEDSDTGKPVVITHPDSPASHALYEVARQLAAAVSIHALRNATRH